MTKAAILKLSDYREKMQVESPSIQQMDAEKLAQDSIEVEKKNLTSTEILNKNLQNLAKIIKDQGALGKVTDKAKETQFFGGAGGAVKDRVEDIKEFFTLRGFLDKTGIVEKGSTGLIGGVADKALEKREAKQQYVGDMMKTDPTVRLLGPEKAKEVFENRFEKIQPAGLAVQKNEKELERLRSAGLTEEQVQRSPEYKKKAELEANLAKVDPRFRGSDTLQLTKDTKQSTEGNSKVVPLFSGDSKQNAMPESVGENREGEIDAERQMEEQTAVLHQIEENTRPVDAKPKKSEKKDDGGGGLFDGLIDTVKTWAMGFGMAFLGKLKVMTLLIGKGLLAGAKILFSGPVLLKLLTKVFPIAMIVGSVVNGLIDGVKKFIETGSITEALIAGLGGMLSFLTFGLVDGETIKNLVSGFTNLVDEYITQPLANFFNNIKDAIVGFIEGIGIPEISFSVFGKKIKFGPYYPFKKDDAPAAPETPTESNKPARVESGEKPQTAPEGTPAKDNLSSERRSNVEAAKQSQLRAAKKAEEDAQFEQNPYRKKALLDGAKKARELATSYDKELSGAPTETSADRANKRQDAVTKRTDELLAKAPANVKDDIGYQRRQRQRAELEVDKGRTLDGKPLVQAEKNLPMKDTKPVDATTSAGKPLVQKSVKTKIGGEDYIEGAPLSDMQMIAISSAKTMNNKKLYSPAVEKQYADQKSVKPATDVATKPAESMDSVEVYNKSADNDSNRQSKTSGATNVVVAPTNNSTNNNTTVAAPFRPRGNESSVNDYVKRRAVY